MASDETIRARPLRRRKSRAVYTTRRLARAICRNPHISNNFQLVLCLTLRKSGSYTHMMKAHRVSAVAAALAALAAALPVTGRAQPNQRSMYVSVVDEAGAPVPDLGTGDFVVREDNTAREVLSVRPADEPMQIAL